MKEQEKISVGEIAGSLFDIVPTKSQERQIQIIKATIKEFASTGFERTTYDSIAKRGAISRPLVHHYFPRKEELVDMVVKYIRANFQQLAVRFFSAEKSPKEQLNQYVKSTFWWLQEYPEHVKVWLLFYYYCGINPKYRKLNTELVDMGQRRIAAILEKGNESRDFKVKDVTARAKTIQNQITGALLACCTEDRQAAVLQSQTVGACQIMASSNFDDYSKSKK